MSDIKGFKFINGVDVIAKLGKSDETGMELINPVALQVTQDEHGNMGGGFAPMTPFGETKTVGVEHSHVMFQYEPNEEIRQAYQQAFSGLVVPTKPQFLTETN